MSLPKMKIEAAFFTEPLAVTPTYTDITADVLALSIHRGRQHELSRVEPGTCKIRLNDRAARKYDPDNTASQYYGNLLTENQASLETNTTGWLAKVNCTIARSTAQSLDGAASLAITASGAGGGATQVITSEGTSGIVVAPSTQYTALADFRAAATARSCRVGIRWYDSGGNQISDSMGTAATDSTSGWQLVIVTATSPSNAAYAAVLAQWDVTAAGEVHYVDQISLAGGSSTFWYSPTMRGLRPMKKVRVSAEWNLLTANQASLETDTAGWAAKTNCTIARSTAQALHGTASLAITASGAGGGATQVITNEGTTGRAVTPNTAYTVRSSWRAAATARACTAAIRWYDSGGSQISDSTGGAVIDSTSGWTTATVSATAPATAAYAAVLLTWNVTAAGEVHYVDQIGLFPGPDIDAWSTGGPYYLFTGYIEAFPLQWADQANTEVELEAVDGFKILNLKKIVSDAYTTQVEADTPYFWWRLNDPPNAAQVVGTSTIADSSGNGRTAVLISLTGEHTQVEHGAPGLLPVDPATATRFTAPAMFERTAGGAFIATGAFSLECWVKTGLSSDATDMVIFLAGGSLGDRVQLGISADGKAMAAAYDDSGSPPEFAIYSTNAITDDRPHHLVMTRDANGTDYALYVDGVSVATGTAGFVADVSTNSTTRMYLGDGATMRGTVLQEAAGYTTELSSTRVAAHFEAGASDWLTAKLSGSRVTDVLDTVGWPAADRSLDAGQFQMAAVTTQLVTTSALAYLEALVESEGYPAILFIDGQGRVVFHDRAHATPSSSATFGDGSGELVYLLNGTAPVLDDLDIWNEVVFQAENGAAQFVADTTSQDNYVTRTLPKTGLKNASDADVLTLANAFLARYKDPSTRLKSLVVWPQSDPGNLYPQVLGRELHDRLLVKRARFTGGGIPMSLDVRINGVDLDYDAEKGDWLTVWQLAPT